MTTNIEAKVAALLLLTLPLLAGCGLTTATTEAPTAIEETATEEPLREPLSTGERAPDFTLPDSEGNDVRLADELSENQLVILVFYRAFDCSLCIDQLAEIQADQAMYEEKGAQIIALAVQSPEHAGRSVENSGAQFPILADSEHIAAGSFGVYDIFSDRLAAPSVFVIGPGGQILWNRIVERTIERIPSETILENLP